MSEQIEYRCYSFRFYPSPAQEEKLEQQLELCRRLFNKALWWRQGQWEMYGRNVTRKEQLHALVDLKVWEPAYRELPCGVLEDVVTRVDLAYKDFFRRCKKPGVEAGYPKEKPLGVYRSLTVPRSREFMLEEPAGSNRFAKLWVGRSKAQRAVLGALRVRKHRAFPSGANVRRVTLKREPSGKWFAQFGFDVEVAPPVHEGPAVGLDVGLDAFITTSDGQKTPAPRKYAAARARLRRKQRTLLRRQKGSKGREKARREVAILHEKVKNQRRNFLHNESRRLVDDYSLIAIEDLRLENLVKNHHLAASISDVGWGEFARQLKYKAVSAGAEVVCVNPRGTSQMCSGCGEMVEKTLATRIHRCEACELVLDRDHNAAKNILRLAESQRSAT